MLFEQIDVRPNLLHKSSRRTGSIAAQVEIDLSSCNCNDALNLLMQGDAAARVWKVDIARLRFCDGIALARKERDYFIEAAGIMKQTILMDSGSGPQSQVHFLQEAVELLDYEVYRLVDALLDTPEAAHAFIPPRQALLELARHNLAAFQTREKSLHLAETKERLDDLLVKCDWFTAENVARVGVQNAVRMFGAEHWWVGVMNVRLATALLRQQKVKEATPIVSRTAALFDEWTNGSDHDVVFKNELTAVASARSDLGIYAS